MAIDKLIVSSALSALVCVPLLASNRVIDLSESEKVVVFDVPGSYTWTVPNNLVGDSRLLVVGGGGAGGGISGGGGGGGQVIYMDTVSLTAGNSYSLTVGDGGIASGRAGGNGGESSFSGSDFGAVTAIGGGGGAGGWSQSKGLDGANGGGAGGNGNGAAFPGGQPTVEGGFPGGDQRAANWAYGGGGGAAEAGHGDQEEDPCFGGRGLVYDITGEDKMYGYGGGAGARNSQLLSGARNEYGRGWVSTALPNTPGEEGTGGGGGGGRASDGSGYGADGGCGTVIIRYFVDTAQDDFTADIVHSIRIPTIVTFTAELGTDLSEMTWDFGDGSAPFTTTDIPVAHEYTAPGLYTVTMTRGAHVVLKTGYVEIISGVLYVDAASENPVPPYDSRSTAATRVADALAYAADGYEVRIAPGVYSLAIKNYNVEYIDVTNAVTIIGEGASPTNVVLRSPQKRKWYNDKVMRINNAGAKVENVTLADGWVSNGGWGGCLLIDNLGGVVTNCVIRNGGANIATQARAGGAYLNGGVVTHTIFEDCYYDASQSLTYARLASGVVVAGDAKVENCLFRNCTGDAGDIIALTHQKAVVRNCTVVDGRIGFCLGGNNNNIVTNESFAIGCGSGKVENCAVYNVKRIAFNDFEETYDAAFGPTASDFITCANATKSDFVNYDAWNLRPAVFGILHNTGTAVPGFEYILDLAGRPRIIGKTIDIGCYEGSTAGFAIMFK